MIHPKSNPIIKHPNHNSISKNPPAAHIRPQGDFLIIHNYWGFSVIYNIIINTII
ncbi:hypothetical protein CBFG_02588 [Clostridiales bacterium 1_7_47FAA]|nr:hypothetical protein CBFG_02588 [Clostridiales bacterium 1_7_47FAA]